MEMNGISLDDVIRLLTRMRDEQGDPKSISAMISEGHVVVVLQFPKGAKEAQ
jgi:hypothetical protein